MSSYEHLRLALASTEVILPDMTPVPAVGQLWRASWDDTVVHVCIDAVEEDEVTVLPVTADPTLAPNPRFYLDAADSPLGYAAAVWREPRTALPLFVLDGCYGSMPEIDEEPIGDATPLSDRARAADPGWTLAQQVDAAMSRLGNAFWTPEAEPVGPLRDLMQRAGVSARRLRDRLALPEGVIELLLDHAWWVGDEAQRSLADTLGVGVAELPHTDPFSDDPELPRAVNAPGRKRSLRQRAARDGISEAEARLRAAYALRLAPTRQARQAIDERSKWDQLLDHYLSNA